MFTLRHPYTSHEHGQRRPCIRLVFTCGQCSEEHALEAFHQIYLEIYVGRIR